MRPSGRKARRQGRLKVATSELTDRASHCCRSGESNLLDEALLEHLLEGCTGRRTVRNDRDEHVLGNSTRMEDRRHRV
jgi:hypothetical protein